MRIIKCTLAVLVAGVLSHGCTCASDNGAHPDAGLDAGINPDALAGGNLVIMPPDATLDITPGGVAPTQAYVALTHTGVDVSSMATWSVDDPSLGSFSGTVFTANTVHGGSTFVRATWMGLSAYATLHVKLHASVPSDNCSGCPAFPGPSTPVCSASAATPTILYPPNGIVVPPNMNVLETQFDQGQANTLFEIDYENAATDVRVLTLCNPITDSKGNSTNGCAYDLSQAVWDYLAQSNRGGDPVSIIVRATNASGSCIATSSTMISISFAQNDLNGGIYYWQSVSVAGLQGATGGIFRYDFGKRGQTPQAFLAPTSAGGTMQRCIGCHFVSRDGQKMTFGNDDPDADDEYSDLKASLLDIGSKVIENNGNIPPGFQAFSPDHTRLLASDGTGKNASPAFFLFDGDTGAAATPATVSSGSNRGTQPDWSADGSSIVFVQPTSFTFNTYHSQDDSHFTGGSLFTMTAGSGFGTPSVLLASAGENNYYPAFSPDGAFVIFNRAPLSGSPSACTANSCPNDAFSNPNARIMLMPAGGGTPIDLANLNLTGPLTNSWPRFAPTVQSYKGANIAWVTFSSMRDYGDVVRNSVPVGGVAQQNCYPPESAENTSNNKMVTTDPTCRQPQLWMAAIDLDKAGTGSDGSYPAFWLPFQDSTSHNHIAQWVVSIIAPPPPDGGTDGSTCIADGASCTTGGAACCNGFCCSDNTCGCLPIQ